MIKLLIISYAELRSSGYSHMTAQFSLVVWVIFHSIAMDNSRFTNDSTVNEYRLVTASLILVYLLASAAQLFQMPKLSALFYGHSVQPFVRNVSLNKEETLAWPVHS